MINESTEWSPDHISIQLDVAHAKILSPCYVSLAKSPRPLIPDCLIVSDSGKGLYISYAGTFLPSVNQGVYNLSIYN